MKRESKPSRRLRMHIVVLVADGYSPTQIARILFCSRTTVYTLVERFLLTCSPKPGSPSFSVQQKRTAASLVSYNAGDVLIEEAPHDAVAQSTRPPIRERRH